VANVAEFARLIEGISVAMVTTHSAEGGLNSRPMLLERLEPDATLIFLTHLSSRKVHEAESDPRVSVTFVAAKGDRYVAAFGRGAAVVDREEIRSLWNPTYRAWFPRGLKDPDIAMLKVAVERVEYWDVPRSRLVRLWGVVRALVTRRPAEAGDHGTIVFG
jgi:general stress protein 26